MDAGTKVIQKKECKVVYGNSWDSAWVDPAHQSVNEALRNEVRSQKQGISDGN